jgi:thymidine phosphorylase
VSVPAGESLRLIRAGVDTYQEPVVYLRADSAVCRSEGFEAQARVLVETGGRSLVCTLNVVTDGGWLGSGVAALSEAAWRRLHPRADDLAPFRQAAAADSASRIRAKVYGQSLTHIEYEAIMRDAIAGRLSDIELAAFLAACVAQQLEDPEVTALTQAMVHVGTTLTWHSSVVLDKHCVGGLPGNRTTPIVVAIVAACGQLIPKTSSRAITSPAGTADAMATLAPVELDLAAMRRVVERKAAASSGRLRGLSAPRTMCSSVWSVR